MLKTKCLTARQRGGGEGAHRADVGQVGVPELHSPIGGQCGKAAQLPVILEVPHLVVFLPPSRLRGGMPRVSNARTSAALSGCGSHMHTGLPCGTAGGGTVLLLLHAGCQHLHSGAQLCPLLE